MFGSLKDKLKSWLSKSKPVEEEKEVKTKKVKAKPEKSKEIKIDKPKIKEKVKKIPKSSTELEQERKISDQLIKEIKEEEVAKIQEKVEKEIQESKPKKGRGIFGLFRKKEEPESAEIETKQEEKEQEITETEKKGFFDRFKTKLTNEKFDELFQELEMILLQNNVAFEVVQAIKKELKYELVGKNLSEVNVGEKLKLAIEKILPEKSDILKEIRKVQATKQPVVIACVGINGSGKTTTIAKLTHKLQKEGLSVCLAAADTFRAASIEQLQQHADKLKVHLTHKEYGTDPASVGFDAVSYAKKHHIDVVIIDTAGRMNTKDSLMKEMEKIIKVNKPDFKIFVGESITGNDATEQAKAFNDSIDLSGIILSKADVDEKGGTALSVSFITKKPIFFLGTGQTYNDLEVFDKKQVMKNLGFD